MDDSRVIDEALIVEAQAGSSSALDMLIRRWQRRLYAHAMRILGHDDKAWDACQDAWIGIVRGLGRLHDPAAFSAWAYRIVTNKCKDRLSQDARAGWFSSEDYADGLSKPQDANRLEISEAINLLPGQMQAVLVLRYFEGFAVNEIVRILGIPEGTVKSRLNRARTELKKILETQHGRL